MVGQCTLKDSVLTLHRWLIVPAQVIKKHQKELETLRKRHQKEKMAIQKSQCIAIDKICKVIFFEEKDEQGMVVIENQECIVIIGEIFGHSKPMMNCDD